MFNDITDDMILKNQQREKYLTVRENPDYEVVSGDNMSKIASKFKVSIKLLLAYNNISDKDAGKIAIGQRLKIPPTRVARNIKNLGDVSKALGISQEAIESIKFAEDGTKMGKNNFHNHAYIDGAGVKTIGIGHVVKAGEAEVLNNQEVCETFANDLLKARGRLFLNEVYRMLGIDETKAGQVVGWVYNPDNPTGDNFVDFGIYNMQRERVRAFVNGYEPNILLDFNVDGVIWDLAW